MARASSIGFKKLGEIGTGIVGKGSKRGKGGQAEICENFCGLLISDLELLQETVRAYRTLQPTERRYLEPIQHAPIEIGSHSPQVQAHV